MKRRGLVTAVALLSLVGLLFSACAQPAPTPSPAPAPKPTATPTPTPSPTAKPITARLTHGYAPGSARDILAKKLAELVDKETNGRLKIEIFPSAQLYKTGEDIDATRAGYVELCASSVGALQTNVDEGFGFGALPFFQSVDHMHRWYQHALGGGVLNQRVEQKGLKNVTFVDLSHVQLAFAKKPLRTLADYKGLKMRSSGGVFAELTKAAGASPITLAAADAFVALQQGTVDGGTFTGPSTLYAQKWQSVAPYGQTWPVMTSQSITASLAWYKALPQDIRQIIETKVAPVVWDFSAKTVEDEESKAMAGLKKEMKELTELSFAEASSVADKVMAGWSAQTKADFADYMKALEQTKK